MMTPQEKARTLRPLIEKISAFLDDTDALEAVELFPWWKTDTHYEKESEDDVIRVRDPEDGLLYKLIPSTHDSQDNWMPHMVPAIWRRVDEPTEEWPEWIQPIDAEDAYAEGKKVSHNGHHWINTINNNVWEPGVYGWDQVE